MSDIAAADLRASAPRRREILGVEVEDLARAEALAQLHAAIGRGLHRPVTFLNAHNANLAFADPALRAALSRFVVLSDGIGVDIAAMLLHGKPFQANLNGTDFVPDLLTRSPFPLRVGLFGGRPGIAEKAAASLAARDGRHQFRVIAHGYVEGEDEAAALAALEQWKPDVLLVAMGVPRQEMWIANNITPAHCTLAFGVGALFDFLAGVVPRAPGWMRTLRLEWVYRLIQEPGRMWRRYILGNPLFIARVVRQKLTGRATAQVER